MASRYWVGGTAAWDGSAGAKWALTSGGAGGQAVPTSADDVFFDAASGAVTVSCSAAPACRDLTCTGFTGTLNGSGSHINAERNVTLAAGMTATNLELKIAHGTLVTNGKSILTLTIEGTVATTAAVTVVDLIFWESATLTIAAGTTFSVQYVSQTGGALAINSSAASAATFHSVARNVLVTGATITYIAAVTGTYTYTASRSVDGGNNTGWTFLPGGDSFFELGAF